MLHGVYGLYIGYTVYTLPGIMDEVVKLNTKRTAAGLYVQKEPEIDNKIQCIKYRI